MSALSTKPKWYWREQHENLFSHHRIYDNRMERLSALYKDEDEILGTGDYSNVNWKRDDIYRSGSDGE